MQEEYVKEKKIVDKSKEEMNKILIQSIINTNNNIKIAQKNYEFAEDDLIDYYTYQIKANQSKLDYLTRLAKSKNIVFDLKQNKAV